MTLTYVLTSIVAVLVAIGLLTLAGWLWNKWNRQ